MIKIKNQSLIKTKTVHDGKKYVYYRPSKIREIPLKTSSNRGFSPSLKPHLKNLNYVWEYESQIERDFILLLEQDPNCIDLQTQPLETTYINEKGNKIKIYPDCWAIFKEGREFLFDIKTETEYRKLVLRKNWNLRTESIQQFCKKMGWTYQVITEKKIRCIRLNNIKDLLVAAKHFSPLKLLKIKNDIGQFNSSLEKFLETPKKLIILAKLLNVYLPLNIEEIIALLKYKIYFQHISIDWNIPLEETLLTFKGEFPCTSRTFSAWKIRYFNIISVRSTMLNIYSIMNRDVFLLTNNAFFILLHFNLLNLLNSISPRRNP